jgi:PKD repeat protein
MKRILLILALLALLVIPISASESWQFTGAAYSGEVVVASVNEAWATIHDRSAGTTTAAAVGINLHSSATTNQYSTMYRSYIAINTASLPDGYIVTNATITLKEISSITDNYGGSKISFCSFTPDNIASVTTSDFNNFGNVEFGSKLLSDMVTDGVYTFPIDISLISTTGYTIIGIRGGYDITNTPPTWGSSAYQMSCAFSTSAANIILNVTMELAPPTPTANFTGTPTSGSLPLTVQFNDTSTGTPLYWSWDFGDGFYYAGQSEFAQNPTHTYNVIGLFNVSLFVQNETGSDEELKTGYINVTSSTGAYNLKVNPLTKNLTSMAGVNISVWTDSGYTSLYNSQETTAYFPYYSASLPMNYEYYILMNKTGYFDRHYTVYINQNREIDLVMYALSEGNLEVSDYTAIHVYPYNTYTGATVSGALVSYYTDSGRTTLYASSYVVGSAASAYLLQNETYYGRITYNGYYPYDFSVATGTSASIERTYHMNPYTTPSTTGTGTVGPTPTYMTVATLSSAERDYKTQLGMDIWYQNADFLSELFFIAVVMGTLMLIMGSAGKRR